MTSPAARIRAEALKWGQTMQISWSQQMAYKLHFLLIVLGPTLVFFLVKWNLWTSIYAMPGVTRIQGYDVAEMVRYQVWVMVLAFFSQGYNAMNLAEDIRLGRISSHLVYPFDLWQFHTASFLAFQAVQGVVAGVTLAITTAAGVIDAPAPGDLAAGIGLATLVGCFWYAVTYAMGLGAFWLEETWVLRVIFTILCSFLSGAILPLDLYPAWLRELLAYSPFPYVTFVPVRVLMGAYRGSVLLAAGMLVVWTVVAAAIALVVWRRGLRLYTAAGM